MARILGDTVGTHALVRYLREPEHGSMDTLVGTRELLHARHATHDDIVPVEHDECLVPDETPREGERIARASHRLLIGEGYPSEGVERADTSEHLRPSRPREDILQLIGSIEISGDRLLAAREDDEDIRDARRDRIPHEILDDGCIHDGEELLRDRLRDGEESRPVASGEYDTLGDHGFLC